MTKVQAISGGVCLYIPGASHIFSEEEVAEALKNGWADHPVPAEDAVTSVPRKAAAPRVKKEAPPTVSPESVVPPVKKAAPQKKFRPTPTK